MAKRIVDLTIFILKNKWEKLPNYATNFFVIFKEILFYKIIILYLVVCPEFRSCFRISRGYPNKVELVRKVLTTETHVVISSPIEVV